MSNTFGHIYRLTTFGESHGEAIGGIVDGFPAGIPVDVDAVQRALDRRRPGQSQYVTARDEADRVHFLSGIFDGKSTGTPIGFVIPNADQRSDDYEVLRDVYRPSHADYTYQAKYGIRDYRGGGRSSARETASRVVGGALAMQYLERQGVSIIAYVSSIGSEKINAEISNPSEAQIEASPVRCPDAEVSARMEKLLESVRSSGNSVGGTVTCVIEGVPAGLGEPVFDRLNAMLAGAMLSINAAKGFELGMGFDGAMRLGSEMIDVFTTDTHGNIITATNHSGGIQGGISNGMPIIFRVAFKPVATMMREIPTVDREGNDVTIRPHGRHDPCVVPRAVPVVEAMAAMVILDAWLMNKSTLG